MEKCRDKDVTAYGYLPEMEKYFGMYRSGNYWIYKNQDSTKTDSIYISDFIEKIEKEKSECFTFPTRTFKIHSKHLAVGYDTILNGSFMNNCNCCMNYFSCAISSQMNSSINTRPVSASDIPEIFYDSLIVRNVKYGNVLFFESNDGYYHLYVKAYFAPDIGIIQFVSQNDTFSLTNYHLQ